MEGGYIIFIVKNIAPNTVEWQYISEHKKESTANNNIKSYKESPEYTHTEFTILPIFKKQKT